MKQYLTRSMPNPIWAAAICWWLMIALCGAPLALPAQSTFYTYGRPGVSDGGTVIVPENIPVLPAGHFMIGGYTYGPMGDSTFIMELDAMGVIYNQAVFKLSDPGSNDRLTDLRFDAAGDLIGCGYNFGAPNDHNGWYFKIPAALGALTWQHRIQLGPVGEVYQPFCIWESKDPMGNPFEYVLSGKQWDPTPFEDPWVAHVAIPTGALTSHNTLSMAPNQPDLFVNMLETSNILYTLGDVDYAAGIPLNGFIRPSITPLDDITHAVVAPWAHSYLASTTTTPEIHSSDFIDYNAVHISTGYGFMKYQVWGWNTFWLLRTINGVQPDPFFPVHYEYDLPFVQSERSEEVIPYGPNNAVMLVEGDDPVTGRDIFLAAANINTGAPAWARRFGTPGNGEYLFHGSQSQMMVLGTDLFFIGIQEVGGIEDALLVKVSSFLPNTEDCVADELLVMDTLELDSMFTWIETPGNQKEAPQGENVFNAPLPDSTICNACPISLDPAYTTITTGVAAGAYTVWPDKVYIPANTVITVNGTLDITQADIVLDECARIVIAAGGHLRANNSTFRPCDELKTWDGIYFDEPAVGGTPNGSGFFNDCVLKNMLNGIYVNAVPSIGQTTFDVRITDNSFINCFFGIRVNQAIMNDPITGNTFMIDTRGIDYQPAMCPTVPPYTPAAPFHLGIMATNATFEGSISQNDFINTLDAGNIVRFEGITFLDVNEANITLNRFTNMWFSVGIVRGNNIAVENNDVEITQQYNSQEVQIWFERSTMIWVTGNHLVNSVEDYTTGLVLAAIYCEDSWFYNIKENTIEGFIVGIQALRTVDFSQIIENKITNVNLAGIWVEEGMNLDVACNQIKLRARGLTGTIGIRYQTGFNVAPVGMRFRGNCIFEADVAMEFTNPGGACIPVPIITNNFLYNYFGTGMQFTWMGGFVGTSNVNPLLAAHNTFNSNMGAAGVLDVINMTPPCPLMMGGNWGILGVGIGVGIVLPLGNVYHSYADCGLQIDNQPAQNWTIDDQCDQFFDNITVFIPNIIAGDYEGFDARLQALGTAGDAQLALEAVIKAHDLAAAEPFYQHIIGSSLVSERDKIYLRYDWLLYHRDHAAALALLPTLAATPRGTQLYMQLEQLRLTLLVQRRSWAELTAAETALLENLALSGDLNADIARAYQHLVSGDKPYIFEPIVMPAFVPSMASLSVKTDHDHMEIYPNPANDQLSVKFSFTTTQAPWVRITDAVGRTVHLQQLDMGAGTFTLDIGDFVPGAYVVSLESGSAKSLYKHLLKF